MCSSDCEGCRTLQAALVDALGEQGLSSVNMQEIAARCGMAAEIDRHRCGTLGVCAVEALREEFGRLYAICALSLRGDEPWAVRFLRAVERMVDVLVARPGVMRLCLVETEAVAVPELLEQRARNRERMVGLLARDYAASGEPEELAYVHFEVLAGATARLLQREFLAGRLPELRRAPTRLEQLVSVFQPVAA